MLTRRITTGGPPPSSPFRRLKRSALLAAGLFIALVALRLWWGHEADRRIAAEVATIHARGEPVLRLDFEASPVPDAQDPAVAYAAAGGSIRLTRQQDMVAYGITPAIPLDPGEVRLLGRIMAANPTALQRARSARALPRPRGGIRLPQSLPAGRPMTGRFRGLAPFLQWSALYHHSVGDDAEAVEAIRDLEGLVPAADRQSPFITSVLEGIAIDEDTCATIVEIAPWLEVGASAGNGAAAAPGTAKTPSAPGTPPKPSTGPATNPVTRRPASRAQVQALIADLLDESAAREGMVRAVWGERMAVLANEPGLEQGVPAPVALAIGPAWKLDTLRVVRWYGESGAAAAVAQPNWPAAAGLMPHSTDGPQQLMPQKDPAVSRLSAIARPVSSPYRPPGRYVFVHFLRMANRRMAAVSLAVRLYRSEHGGEWPRSLNDLRPGYLAAVPADPFAADGRPLAYRLDGTGPNGPGPVVYSVGENGTDEGGDVPPAGAEAPILAWKDLVVPLAHGRVERPPASAAPGNAPGGTSGPDGSGEAQDDDGDERGGGGQSPQKDDGQQRPQDRE